MLYHHWWFASCLRTSFGKLSIHLRNFIRIFFPFDGVAAKEESCSDLLLKSRCCAGVLVVSWQPSFAVPSGSSWVFVLANILFLSKCTASDWAWRDYQNLAISTQHEVIFLYQAIFASEHSNGQLRFRPICLTVWGALSQFSLSFKMLPPNKPLVLPTSHLLSERSADAGLIAVKIQTIK